MGLDFAIDALYASGWHAEVKGLPTHRDGRAYPSADLVRDCFAEQGLELSVRHIQLFDCYRAEWTDREGQPRGAVVGQTAEEASVYALSRLLGRAADPA
jgi:hypothetical protein